MKTLGFFVLTLLVAVGVFAGLLYWQIVPAAPIANSSPIAATALQDLGLYSPAVQPAFETASPESTKSADSAEQKTLDAEKVQLDAEKKELFDQTRQSYAPRPKHVKHYDDASSVESELPLSPKLADIYDTMSPEALVAIFDKQTDSEVVRALNAMDEKKAGEVLAAMPSVRAAKLAAILGRPAVSPPADTAS
jgi:flagellar motility protein MotE (MotC chaperone)